MTIKVHPFIPKIPSLRMNFLHGLWMVVGLCTNSMALAIEPCTVPLELVNVQKGAKKPAEYKLGIWVGLGGGAPQLYEFDTGGAGFWAAYTPQPPAKKGQWWGPYQTVQPNSLSITYTSGNEYSANFVETLVALYKPQGKAFEKRCESSAPIGMAQITNYQNNKQPKDVAAWNTALATGQPPLFGHFYGDFGAALHPIMTANGSNGVYSPLPQLPQQGLINGFIVHVGALKKSAPTLTIGLTQREMATFTTRLPMNLTCQTAQGAPQKPSPSCPPYPDFPVGNVPVYSEQVTNADLAWKLSGSKGRSEQTFSAVGLTIDTGAPATTLWQNTSLFVEPTFLRKPSGSVLPVTGPFKTGVDLTLRAGTSVAGGANLDFDLRTGQKQTVNQVLAAVRQNDGGPTWSGYLNTGLMLYTHYDVLFNLAEGWVGFRRARD